MSDTVANFHHAWKQQYMAKNFTQNATEHVKQVMPDGERHNNQIESSNGATIRHREKVARGLKREDSPILTGLSMYHNFGRPHQGLVDPSMTLAEAEGINVQGDNMFLTLIQAAVKAEMSGT